MNFDDALVRINLSLDLFLKKESLMFTSLSYSQNEDDLYDNNINLFGYNDDLNNISGNFDVWTTLFDNQIGSSLIEFLNFDFDNFKDYFIFFTKYFGKYIEKLEPETYMGLESPPAYTPDKLIPVVKKIYKTDKSNLKKIQNIFMKAVDFIYNINERKDLNPLNLKQRFYILEALDSNFSNFAFDLNYQSNFSFSYPREFHIDMKQTEKNYISRIKEFDPEGNKLLVNNQFESDNLFSIFYITLYHLTFITDTYIRKCKNCHRYFLTSKSNTVYCENVYTGNKTCREIGNELTQKRKEEKEPVYGKYRSIYAKKAVNAKRNSDIQYYQDEYNAWKKTAQDFMEDIRNGKKTYDEFDEWLDENK